MSFDAVTIRFDVSPPDTVQEVTVVPLTLEDEAFGTCGKLVFPSLGIPHVTSPRCAISVDYRLKYIPDPPIGG